MPLSLSKGQLVLYWYYTSHFLRQILINNSLNYLAKNEKIQTKKYYLQNCFKDICLIKSTSNLLFIFNYYYYYDFKQKDIQVKAWLFMWGCISSVGGPIACRHTTEHMPIKKQNSRPLSKMV